MACTVKTEQEGGLHFTPWCCFHTFKSSISPISEQCTQWSAHLCQATDGEAPEPVEICKVLNKVFCIVYYNVTFLISMYSMGSVLCSSVCAEGGTEGEKGKWEEREHGVAQFKHYYSFKTFCYSFRTLKATRWLYNNIIHREIYIFGENCKSRNSK